MSDTMKKSIILKDEFDNPNIWKHIAISLGLSPDVDVIEVASTELNLIIPFDKEKERKAKIFNEARHFVNRLLNFDTLSHEEIKAICNMTAVIAETEMFKTGVEL
jgi:hypothetical protein